MLYVASISMYNSKCYLYNFQMLYVASISMYNSKCYLYNFQLQSLCVQSSFPNLHIFHSNIISKNFLLTRGAVSFVPNEDLAPICL